MKFRDSFPTHKEISNSEQVTPHRLIFHDVSRRQPTTDPNSLIIIIGKKQEAFCHCVAVELVVERTDPGTP